MRIAAPPDKFCVVVVVFAMALGRFAYEKGVRAMLMFRSANRSKACLVLVCVAFAVVWWCLCLGVGGGWVVGWWWWCWLWLFRPFGCAWGSLPADRPIAGDCAPTVPFFVLLPLLAALCCFGLLCFWLCCLLPCFALPPATG